MCEPGSSRSRPVAADYRDAGGSPAQQTLYDKLYILNITHTLAAQLDRIWHTGPPDNAESGEPNDPVRCTLRNELRTPVAGPGQLHPSKWRQPEREIVHAHRTSRTTRNNFAHAALSSGLLCALICGCLGHTEIVRTSMSPSPLNGFSVALRPEPPR